MLRDGDPDPSHVDPRVVDGRDRGLLGAVRLLLGRLRVAARRAHRADLALPGDRLPDRHRLLPIRHCGARDEPHLRRHPR